MKTKLEETLIYLNCTISQTKHYIEIVREKSSVATDIFAEKYSLKKAQILKKIILEAKKESEEIATNLCYRLDSEIHKLF